MLEPDRVMTGAPPLLKVEGLTKTFGQGRSGKVFALADVDFSLNKGETLGVVGESGSGKTTLGRTLLRLTEPSAGRVRVDGEDIAALSLSALKPLRRRLQIIFQDPFGALNPRHTVGKVIGEPLAVHGVGSKAERAAKVRELLDAVGLEPDAVDRYPHEFSGGQRQRIAIARAIALEPDLVVADEPVSALDVSIQSQILNLIADLRRERGIAFLFISHDLSVVRHVSDRVAVMYFGRIVELAETDALFAGPAHPYTAALLSAVPHVAGDAMPAIERVAVTGELPDPSNPPSGCPFAARCPKAMDVCRRDRPALVRRKVSERGTREVACHLFDGAG
ncbi:MAG: oligopeptide/dipeptide ABC transporter ATP-binding protein [Pseudomonadota bacterium]